MDNTIEASKIEDNQNTNHDDDDNKETNKNIVVSSERKGTCTKAIEITEEGCAQLMKLLYQRGYFQKYGTLESSSDISSTSPIISTKVYSASFNSS